MFELKFAAEVSDLTGTWPWAVAILALEYYSGITLPALAEESGPGISRRPWHRQFIVGTFIWVWRVEIGIHPAHRIQYSHR